MQPEGNVTLARNLCLAFLANQLRITPRSTERYISDDPKDLGETWYHLAEYGLKLTMGYLPFNLEEMVLPPAAHQPELPIQ
jgi:hypothetical protein